MVFEKFLYYLKINSKEHYIIELKLSLNYNIKADKWREIADYDVGRLLAAYTVLEGKVFVTRGVVNGTRLTSVKTYG